jgi:hypothetical protein
MRKVWSVVTLSLILLTAAPGAQAAPITLGPPLSGVFGPGSCIEPGGCTLVHIALPGTEMVSSPVDGVITSWSVKGASAIPGYAIRTITRTGKHSFIGGGSSSAETPSGGGVETFATDLPIKKGELLGLDVPMNGAIGVITPAGAESGYIYPILAEGHSTIGGAENKEEEAFDAQVQIAPTISLFAATSGPSGGGTTVLIDGTELEGTASVKFGPTTAAFTQISEGALIAVSPAGVAGSVPISVTTVAGTATSSQQFTYLASATPTPNPTLATSKTCTVPKLTGKSLKASKKKIKGADCKVGEVTKKKRAKAATGKVVGQSKKPGTVLPAGTIVKVTLGKG